MFTQIQINALIALLQSKLEEIDKLTLAQFDKKVISDLYNDILQKIQTTTDVEIYLDHKERKKASANKKAPEIPPQIVDQTIPPVPATTSGLNQEQLSATVKLEQCLETARGRTSQYDFYRPIITILTSENGLTLQQITEGLRKFRKLNELAPDILSNYTDARLRQLLKWNIIKRRTNEFKQWEYLLC